MPLQRFFGDFALLWLIVKTSLAMSRGWDLANMSDAFLILPSEGGRDLAVNNPSLLHMLKLNIKLYVLL